MIKVYTSSVIEAPADAVWAQVRDFNGLPKWTPFVAQSRIENGQPADKPMVVGNLVTPVPVTLDGGSHTVTIPLEAMTYTVKPGDSLTLQIVASATPYQSFTSFGGINVSSVTLSLPTAADGVATPEFLADSALATV